jgi:hypothetical protein
MMATMEMAATIGRWGVALATLAICASPVSAQQSTQPAPAGAVPLALSPPADTGKPRLSPPPLEATPAPGCEAVLDCRLKVIGTVQHNGAVELNAALFKW